MTAPCSTFPEDRLERRLGLRDARALHEPGAPFRIRESLYFLHVPKSGGTSFDSFLSQFFSDEEQSPPELQIERPDLWTQHDHSAHRYRHGAFWLCDVLPLNPDAHFVTFLRDPVKRIISHYWHLRLMEDITDDASHWVEHRRLVRDHARRCSLAEWARTPPGETGSYVRNLFVRMLGGDRHVPGVTRDRCDVWLLHAKRNLERLFTFFGLLEDYAASKELFCRTFGLPLHYARGIEHENVTAGKANREPPSEEALEIIRAENQHDLDLYAFAQRLFQERQQTLSNVHDDLYTGPPAIGELSPDRRRIPAERLRGSGLHRMERTPEGRCLRWTGSLPSACFEFAADLPAVGHVNLKLVVQAAVSQEAVAELRVRLNGCEAMYTELRYEPLAEGEPPCIVALNIFPIDERLSTRRIHSVEVQGPTTTPVGVPDSTSEPRRLGIGIEAVQIEWSETIFVIPAPEVAPAAPAAA